MHLVLVVEQALVVEQVELVHELSQKSMF
jgi:hypothetical protein